jgi:hypothetical protein
VKLQIRHKIGWNAGDWSASGYGAILALECLAFSSDGLSQRLEEVSWDCTDAVQGRWQLLLGEVGGSAQHAERQWARRAGSVCLCRPRDWRVMGNMDCPALRFEACGL